MRLFKTVALAGLIAVLPLTGAMAADPITVPTSTPVELPLHQQSAFDWSGFYAGVYGVGQFSPIGGDQFGLGVSAGVNAQFDFYLVGAEVAVHGLAGGVGETSYGQILGRAGLVVTDDAVVYAAGGYGIDLGAPNQDNVLVGGGIELAVTDAVSVDAQYLHGFPISGGNETNQFTLGAKYHF